MLNEAQVIFLGLDPSMSRTGYCYIGEDGKIITAGYITTSNKLPVLARLHTLKKRLAQGLEKTPKIRVAVEGLAYGPYQMDTRQLWAAYAVRSVLFEAGIKYLEIAPTTVKKYVTGSGKGKKNLLLKFALENFGYSFNDDNVADAFGIAKILYDVWTMPQDLNKVRTMQLAGIRKNHAEYFEQSEPLRLEAWKSWSEVQKDCGVPAEKV